MPPLTQGTCIPRLSKNAKQLMCPTIPSVSKQMRMAPRTATSQERQMSAQFKAPQAESQLMTGVPEGPPRQSGPGTSGTDAQAGDTAELADQISTKNSPATSGNESVQVQEPKLGSASETDAELESEQIEDPPHNIFYRTCIHNRPRRVWLVCTCNFRHCIQIIRFLDIQ